MVFFNYDSFFPRWWAPGLLQIFLSFFRSNLLKRRHPLAHLTMARRCPVRVQSVAMASMPRAEPRAKPAVLSLIGSEHSGGRNVSGSSAVRQFKGQLSARRRRHMAWLYGLSRSDNCISLTLLKLARRTRKWIDWPLTCWIERARSVVIVKMADSIATRFRKSKIIFLKGNNVKVRG